MHVFIKRSQSHGGLRLATAALVLVAAHPVAALSQPATRSPWERNPSPHGLAGVEDVRRYFANQTRLSYSTQHGTQVSYSARDGRIFLWYPGNAAILQGRWRVEETNPIVVRQSGDPARAGEVRRLTQVCFQYGPNTYNPVTRHQGGGWECTLYGFLKATARENRPGDVFNLASGRLPFILSKEEATIDVLSQRKK